MNWNINSIESNLSALMTMSHFLHKHIINPIPTVATLTTTAHFATFRSKYCESATVGFNSILS